ncbi:MAG: PP0621 family protein [Gammaproteobacteria bacterium]|nr:PP0621 family protein [Gammaproteobacteria bacterium]
MNLIRLLALAAIFWLLYRLILTLLSKGRRPAASDTSRPADATIATVVRCAHCGLHVPQGEALKSGDRYYCSEEHKKEAGSGTSGGS